VWVEGFEAEDDDEEGLRGVVCEAASGRLKRNTGSGFFVFGRVYGWRRERLGLVCTGLNVRQTGIELRPVVARILCRDTKWFEGVGVRRGP